MRILEEDGLSAELLEPFRGGASQTEHSQIEIRFHGRKVFDIRLGSGWRLQSRPFRAGDLERVLIDLPKPIPF